MHPTLKYMLFLALSVIPLVSALGVFRYGWTTPSKLRAACMNLTLLGWTLFVLVLLLEVVFYTSFIHSDSFGFTLSAQRWKNLYWTPINAHGYRDIEHTDVQGKKPLFVVGDSFAAGYGIEDYSQRFANVLGQKLGSEWEVFTIARNGWNTQDEYDAVVSSAHTPEVLVLSYYLNDIDSAARKAGLIHPPLVPDIPHGLNFFVENSYAWNFVYWRLYRFASVKDLRENEVNYLLQGYQDEKVWTIHRQELLKFVEWTSARNITLIVLVFPNLHEVEHSKRYTTQIVDFMRQQDVQVIDLATRLTSRDARLNCQCVRWAPQCGLTPGNWGDVVSHDCSTGDCAESPDVIKRWPIIGG